MLRSKAKYTIEGEKCNRFFFNLEKSRGKAETIKELKNKDGQSVFNAGEILKVNDFYEKLFKSERVDEGKMNVLLHNR